MSVYTQYLLGGTVFYPVCTCTAGVKQCLHVCVFVCVLIGTKKNASTRVTKVFTDVIINQIRMILYQIQVQAFLYAITLATSYCRFHPFQNLT